LVKLVIFILNQLSHKVRQISLNSLNAFFHNGEYTLGRYAAEYQQGQTDAFHKACAEMDNKITLIMQLQQGSLLTMLPDTHNGRTTWYAPSDSLPQQLGQTKILFFKNIFKLG